MSIPRCQTRMGFQFTLPAHFQTNKQSPRRREQLGFPPLRDSDLTLWKCHTHAELGTERWYVSRPRLHYHCLTCHTVD